MLIKDICINHVIKFLDYFTLDKCDNVDEYLKVRRDTIECITEHYGFEYKDVIDIVHDYMFKEINKNLDKLLEINIIKQDALDNMQEIMMKVLEVK